MLQSSCERYVALRNRRALLLSLLALVFVALALSTLMLILSVLIPEKNVVIDNKYVIVFMSGAVVLFLGISMNMDFLLRSRVLEAQRRGIKMLSRQTASLVAKARRYEDKENSLLQKLELDFRLIEAEVALNYSESLSREVTREREIMVNHMAASDNEQDVRFDNINGINVRKSNAKLRYRS